MVALGHHSRVQLYWDSVLLPMLCIWFSEQSWQNELMLSKYMQEGSYILPD